MSWTSFSVALVKLMLCARTGRTAKRMAEATGFEARTIHRPLEVDRWRLFRTTSSWQRRGIGVAVICWSSRWGSFVSATAKRNPTLSTNRGIDNVADGPLRHRRPQRSACGGCAACSTMARQRNVQPLHPRSLVMTASTKPGILSRGCRPKGTPDRRPRTEFSLCGASPIVAGLRRQAAIG